MTTLTIRTFEDLLNIVNTQPEWRHRLVKALFPEIDVAKAFQDLAESQKRMETLIARDDERLAQIEQSQQRMEATLVRHDEHLERIDQHLEQLGGRLAQIEQSQQHVETHLASHDARFDQVDGRLAHLETDMRTVKHTMGDLKGSSLEREYRDKAAGIFGRYLRRGHDVTNEVAEQLHDAVAAGQITSEELTQALAADLLWAGRWQLTTELILVIEASWLAETLDVERAAARAAILRTLGLAAVPVVASREWSPAAQAAAHARAIVITTDRSIDDASWHSAVAAWLEDK